MIDQLVEALKQVWKDVGLTTGKNIEQQQQQRSVVMRHHA